MPGKAAKKKEKKEHRIRLNDPELSEVVGALKLAKDSGRGNIGLINSLIGRLSHPKAGGNWNRAEAAIPLAVA
jgi:hypothetical protein